MSDHVTINNQVSTSTMGIKFWAFAIFSSFLLYSFIGNTTLLIILRKNRNIFLNRTFINICLQLIICAFISYIPQVTIVLPETLFENSLSEYKASFIYRIVVSTETFAFFAVLLFIFLLALSRYVFFNLPQFNYIFTGMRMRLIVAFTWLFIAIIAVPEMHFCVQEFNGIYLQWKRDCGTSKISKGLKFSRTCIILGLPIIIFIMHIAIFNNLRQKRIAVSSSEPGESQKISCLSRICKCTPTKNFTSANNEMNKSEISILIQGAVVCAAVELEVLAFKFLRKISTAPFSNETDIRLNILVNCLIICLSAIQPTVYFICNKRIQHYVTVELMLKIKNTKGVIAMKQMLSMLSTKLCCHFCEH